MWSWGYASTEFPDDVELGTDIDSFFARVSSHNTVVWFHNLKFDVQFIYYWLLTHGYEYVEKVSNVGTFTTLVDGLGTVYSLTVKWDNGHRTEFRDSLKKLPMTLREIAIAFKLKETKGDIDYLKVREPGYQPTPEEWDYQRRDVSILAHAMKQTLESGMSKLTVGSDALTEYKSLVNAKSFQIAFPILDQSMDREIRQAYRGGFTYRDPRFANCITRSGIVLDVNSLYPSIMANEYLPYGEPQWCEGRVTATADRPLTIFSVTFTAKLKPGHIPCIQIKGGPFVQTEYLTEIKEPTTLMMTNVDFALYSDHYDIVVTSWGGGWRFRAAKGMFDSYLEKWSHIKEHATGGQRVIAKLFMNALYGKFATNPTVTRKYPVLEDDVVKMKRAPDEEREPVYTAMGVFITSLARNLTIRAAQQNYGSFAYADTDSLHLLVDDIPESIDEHPTRMGAWKLEYHFEAAYYIRAKQYLEKKIVGELKSEDGKYENHIAGVPRLQAEALTFDDISGDSKIIHGKLTPKIVTGGVILEPKQFTLKFAA